MKPFQLVAFALIIAGFAFGLSNLKKTYSEEFTTAILTTKEGATVHKKISDGQYGQAIDGDFFVRAPAGKYMLTSNIRGESFIELTLLGAGILSLLISFRKIK